MDARYESESLGSVAGVCDRTDQSGTPLKNVYLTGENRILRAHLPGRLRLSDPQRSTLAEIGKRLGRKALGQLACVAKPDTILAWYRKLIARKFDGTHHRGYPGRPPIEPPLESLIVQMARENSGWGYDQIEGVLANLGYTVSDQTLGNIPKRHGIAPARARKRWNASRPKPAGMADDIRF